MKEVYRKKMSLYNKKLESLECDENYKLKLISDLLRTRIKRLRFVLETSWYTKINYINRLSNSIEVIEQIKQDILNKVATN